MTALQGQPVWSQSCPYEILCEAHRLHGRHSPARHLRYFSFFCIPGHTSAASGVVNSLPNVAAVTAQANELALVGECDRDYSARGDVTNDFKAVAFAAFWRRMVREPERHGSSSKSH